MQYLFHPSNGCNILVTFVLSSVCLRRYGQFKASMDDAKGLLAGIKNNQVISSMLLQERDDIIYISLKKPTYPIGASLLYSC